nr:anaerobic ribonucleoside-triphosphate reductase activating protein [Corynebacterium lactis]
MPDPARSPIPIAGLTPFSMVDWPGRLVATVFTQGCSWDCPYCHNPALRDTTAPGVIGWGSVVELARRRQGLLDGFVFSGGEPTRHRGLPGAIGQIRDLGFAIGLHTNGMYPALLAPLLDSGLVDWVGLDIKADACAYAQAIGAVSDAAGAAAAARAWESLGLLQAWAEERPVGQRPGAPYRGRSFEVRTTVFDCAAQLDTLPELGRDLKQAGVPAWAIQRSRGEGTDEAFAGAVDVVKPERQRAISGAIEAARGEFPELVLR